jgi:hypothetical protein
MAMSIIASLGVGCALAFSEAILDSSFKDITDVEDYLNLPVVCSIPYICTEKESLKQKVVSVVWFVVLSSGFIVLSGAFIYLVHSGRIVLF